MHVSSFAWRETNETDATFASIIIQRCSFTNVERKKTQSHIKFVLSLTVSHQKRSQMWKTYSKLSNSSCVRWSWNWAGGVLVYSSLIFMLRSCEISNSWTNVIYLCVNMYKRQTSIHIIAMRLSEHVFRTIRTVKTLISIDIRKHVIFALANSYFETDKIKSTTSLVHLMRSAHLT